MNGDIHLSGAAAAPFDAIRNVTSEGREYWSARELMPLLGYEKWERFADAIGRAKIAAHNAGYEPSSQFPGAGKVVQRPQGGSIAVEDYHLSRYACYLVALNGDPRKPEIASAQTYFVIKTREAETHHHGHPLPTKKELAQWFIEADERAEREALGRAQAEAQVTQLEPSAAAWNRLAEIGADVEVADAAKILSRDPNIDIGRNRLFDFMHDQDWIFRGRHNCWKAYQDQVDLGRLRMRPGGEYFHRPSGEYRTGDPTIVITVKGLAELRRLLGGAAQLALVVE